MKRHLLLITTAAILLAACSKINNPTPEPVRYLDESFSQIIVSTVVYSSVSNFELDIYQPYGDYEQNRPLVILAHGGGFFIGSKENPAMVRLATNLAKRGYVAACYNYSLASGFNDVLDSNNALDLVIRALGDSRAVVRFFRETITNGNPYHIDSTKIFAGGNSAGAILASHLGYWDENDSISAHVQTAVQAAGGFEGNRGNPGYSSNVAAVFNLAGGIKSVGLIDQDDVPIISFHGVDDDVVPFDCGDVYSGVTGGADVINICGSNSMHNRAMIVGAQSTLHTYPGKHVPWMDSNTGEPYELFDEIEQKVFAFLYEQL